MRQTDRQIETARQREAETSETDRQRQRDRERKRQVRQTDRQKQRDRERQRQTERGKNRHREKENHSVLTAPIVAQPLNGQFLGMEGVS